MNSTNELHARYYFPGTNKSLMNDSDFRRFPKIKNSIMNGKNVKKITITDAKRMVKLIQSGDLTMLGEANILVEYKKDSEANKIAKDFTNLSANPQFRLNITFKKIK